MSNIPHILAQHIPPTSLYALEQAVLGWAHARNLINGSTCRKQLAKTCEEFGELAAGLNKGKRALIKDGVGDVLVTLIIANGCVGNGDIFYPADGDCWIDPVPQVSRMDSHQLVLELVKELAYVTEYRLDSEWRTGRMLTLIQALTAASRFAGCSLEECLQAAWLEIKDRKGRMIDGVFVKEADLPPVQPTLGERFDSLTIDEQVQVTYGSGTVRSPEQEAPVPPDYDC